MANLVIDIGNTFIKIAVFAQDELLYTTGYSSLDAETFFRITDQ
jgi:pantothenate kinase type III